MIMACQLLLLILACGLAAGAQVQYDAEYSSTTVRFRLAMGSCSKVGLPQPLWNPILEQRPLDGFLWLGDAVYNDRRVLPGWFRPALPESISDNYRQQRDVPGYKQLLESGTTVLGVWDDHDYGINDGGKHYAHREASQALFLDFLQEPENSPRRRRRGVYASYLFRGSKPTQTVKLLLLDARYHRGEPVSEGGDGDMLGSEQWQWLRDQLLDSAALDIPITLIASGIQVLSDLRIKGESWSVFPTSKHRLMQLLRDTNVKGAVLLSGDVHYAELLRLDENMQLASTDNGSDSVCLKYPLLEITSSGLTHTCATMLGATLCNFLLTFWPNSLAVFKPFVELNYGVVSIDWAASPPVITLSIHSERSPVYNISAPVSSLAPPADSGAHTSPCEGVVRDVHVGADSVWVRRLALPCAVVALTVALARVLLALCVRR